MGDARASWSQVDQRRHSVPVAQDVSFSGTLPSDASDASLSLGSLLDPFAPFAPASTTSSRRGGARAGSPGPSASPGITSLLADSALGSALSAPLGDPRHAGAPAGVGAKGGGVRDEEGSEASGRSGRVDRREEEWSLAERLAEVDAVLAEVSTREGASLSHRQTPHGPRHEGLPAQEGTGDASWTAPADLSVSDTTFATSGARSGADDSWLLGGDEGWAQGGRPSQGSAGREGTAGESPGSAVSGAPGASNASTGSSGDVGGGDGGGVAVAQRMSRREWAAVLREHGLDVSSSSAATSDSSCLARRPLPPLPEVRSTDSSSVSVGASWLSLGARQGGRWEAGEKGRRRTPETSPGDSGETKGGGERTREEYAR